MKEIALTNSPLVALVDDKDHPFLVQFLWRAKKSDGTEDLFCAARDVVIGEKKLTVRMHRLITEADDDQMVFHINGNTMDNRRRNLQLRTVNPWTGRAAGFKGVHQIAYRKWRAEISFAGRRHTIGEAYTSPSDAAVAYDQVAVRMFGAMAMTNFPLDNYIEWEAPELLQPGVRVTFAV